MAAKPAPRRGWEAFVRPAQVNQRRYEAVRAYVLEGAPLAEAAARSGYSPSALASPVMRQASLPPDTTVPWWHGRRLHYEFS